MVKPKKKQTKLERLCQYKYPHCQIKAEFQHTVKLGSVTIDRAWICNNCQLAIEKEQKQKKSKTSSKN